VVLAKRRDAQLAESLFFSAVLFTIGVVGVLTRRNAIIVFMCVELMLNAVNLTFIAFAQIYGAAGQVFVFFVMTVAAAEAAVGWRSSSRCSGIGTRELAAYQLAQRLMLLPQAALGAAHPLDGTVAQWLWVVPALPLLGFCVEWTDVHRRGVSPWAERPEPRARSPRATPRGALLRRWRRDARQ